MKARLIIPLVIAFLLPAEAGARTNMPEIGIHAAMEVSLPTGGNNIYKNGAGLTLGANCHVPFGRNFYFEPGLYFTYSAMSAKDLVSFDDKYYYEGAANIYGLRVPLMVGYRLSVSDIVTLHFATGPWLNVNISARQKLLPNFDAPVVVPSQTINLFNHGWKRVDALWGIQLGATFADNYYIGVTTGVAFTPLASFGNRDKKIRIHRNTVAISLGYRF